MPKLQTQPLCYLLCQAILKILPDLLLVSFLLLSSLKLMSGIEQITDIRLSDESYYLHNGLVIFQEGLPPAEWSPLYSLWYWLLKQISFSTNNIELYYCNHKLLTALVAGALYLSLRAMGCERVISVIAGVAFLLSGIPVIWPRPTHFALLFWLVLVGTLPYYQKHLDFALSLGLTCLFISFIRPEYFLSFLVVSGLIGIGILIEIKKARLHQNLGTKLILYVALATIAILALGVPTSSGGRGWWAFASHFALRWTWWTGSRLNPWTEYPEIVSSVFGNVDTIRGALVENPAAFGRFIWENTQGYFTNTADILLGSLKDESPLLKDLNVGINGLIRSVECIVVVIAMVPMIWQRHDWLTSPESRRLGLRLLMLLGSIELTLIPATIIIFPRYHYLMMQALLLIILLSFVASLTLKSPILRVGILKGLVIGLVILLLTPSLNYGWCLGRNLCAFSRSPSEPPPNLTTLRYLQDLEVNQPINLLAAGFEYRTYLENPVNRVDPFAKDGSFQHYLEAHQIEMVITDEWLLNDPGFQEDPEWQNFLDNPEVYGFVARQIPQTNRLLLLKKSLEF